jgi:ribosomal protein S13
MLLKPQAMIAYANFISSESGVAKDKKISDLDDNEFGKVVDAISKKKVA